ncbi:MAG: nicotinate-nucleotide adenylyltransferase [Gammaproteobacteria bacterium]|nr:nicotinate-nucleotide adenylyltransferase [Gammaproteobacteria bacterium]
MAKKIGILGGTFDPVHIGHLRSAIEVLESCGLDEVRLIPGAVPPHRATPQVGAQQRLDMVRLAVEGVPGLSVDDRELRRQGPSWTIDTLLSLRQELPADTQLYFILGQDAFAGLPKWHRWQEILQHCHLLVLQRPQMPVELPAGLRQLLQQARVPGAADMQGGSGQIALLEQTPLPVSATGIRQARADGQDISFLVPDRVRDYIQHHGLYTVIHSI